MGATANPNRRGAIAAALKRCKADSMLSLEDLAEIWGVVKSRFVTVKNKMPDFPPPIPQGTSHIFEARTALKAMQAFERRHDDAAQKLKKTTDAILGNVRTGRLDQIDTGHTPRDLSVLSRLAAEAEERERAQREYIPKAEVAQRVGDVFEEISNFCSRLSNEIDPHGRLDPKVRAKIDERAAEALRRSNKILKDLLSPDANQGSSGKPPRRARKPRA
jgi:hypothetical protein